MYYDVNEKVQLVQFAEYYSANVMDTVKAQPWDSAAGFLMVEEAGGKVTDFTGAPYSVYQHRILATNGLIHEEMLSVINNEKEL